MSDLPMPGAPLRDGRTVIASCEQDNGQFVLLVLNRTPGRFYSVVAVNSGNLLVEAERMWPNIVAAAHDYGEHIGMSVDDFDAEPLPYRSQAARDAQAHNYGGASYWAYLDQHAHELHDYFAARGDTERAESMFTESLSEALRGNDGD